MSALNANVITFDLADLLLPQVIEATRYDVEVIDARTIGGKTYATLGEAVRGAYLALDEAIASRSSSSGVLAAATAAEMTDTGKIYVYVGNESGYTYGNWYYHTDSGWASGGAYNAVEIGQGSVTNEKIAADAVTADKLDLNSMKRLFDLSAQTCVGTGQGYDTEFEESNAALSSGTAVEADESYFGYVKIKITGITNYSQGTLSLRWKGTNEYVCREAYAEGAVLSTGSELELYGSFTVSSADTLKASLIAENYGSDDFFFAFDVEKLYLFKDIDSSYLSVIRKEAYSSVLDYVEIIKEIDGSLIEEGTLSYDKLADDVKELLASARPEASLIDCWGDDFILGTGGNGTTMPSVLQELLGESYTVNNYAQTGETAEEIAFRQGGLQAIVEPFTTIVTDNSSSRIRPVFKCVNGASLDGLSQGFEYNGNDYVYIDGDKFYFARAGGKAAIYTVEHGLEKTYTRPLRMIAEGRGKYHTILVCIGENGWEGGTAESLINVIEAMISYNGNKNYLVIGRPSGSAAERATEEFALASHFGNAFFNAREYISAYGLSDNSLTATSADTTAMKNGEIPPSLLADDGYGNAYFNTSFAAGVYQAGKDLGYWK